MPPPSDSDNWLPLRLRAWISFVLLRSPVLLMTKLGEAPETLMPVPAL